MKDADKPPPLYFRKTIVELGFDELDGQPATSVVLERSADQLKAAIETFYKTHPELARGTRPEFLPKLLVLLHNEKGIGQNDLAKRLQKGNSAIGSVLKALKQYSLVAETGALTVEGVKAMATLSPLDAAARFAALEAEKGVLVHPGKAG